MQTPPSRRDSRRGVAGRGAGCRGLKVLSQAGPLPQGSRVNGEKEIVALLCRVSPVSPLYPGNVLAGRCTRMPAAGVPLETVRTRLTRSDGPPPGLRHGSSPTHVPAPQPPLPPHPRREPPGAGQAGGSPPGRSGSSLPLSFLLFSKVRSQKQAHTSPVPCSAPDGNAPSSQSLGLGG